MFDWVRIWFKSRMSTPPASKPSAVQKPATMRKTGTYRTPAPNPARRSAKQSVPRPKPEFVELDPHLADEIEDNGPGKNVLIRNKYVREDTGTHETLKILDDSILDDDESDGIDPYNTGDFDRSRNWDKRFRN